MTATTANRRSPSSPPRITTDPSFPVNDRSAGSAIGRLLRQRHHSRTWARHECRRVRAAYRRAARATLQHVCTLGCARSAYVTGADCALQHGPPTRQLRPLATEAGLWRPRLEPGECHNPFQGIIRGVDLAHACDEALSIIDRYEQPDRSQSRRSREAASDAASAKPTGDALPPLRAGRRRHDPGRADPPSSSLAEAARLERSNRRTRARLWRLLPQESGVF